MNFDKDKEFDQNMNQLFRLLKKMIKNIPSKGQLPSSVLPQLGKDSNINLNLCFFTFLPLSAEELDELGDLYEQYFFNDEKHEDLSDELSPADLDFLRRNGMRF